MVNSTIMKNDEKTLRPVKKISLFCGDILLIIMAAAFTIVDICFKAILFTIKAACSLMTRFCFAFSLAVLFVLVYLVGLGVSVLMGPGVGSQFS